MQPGKGFLVWLAGLSVLGFLATDMYLPAFAAIQEDLQTPASGKKPSITVQRTRTGFTVTPDDDSLAYMAAGRLEEGRFITETYDTSPLPGNKLTIASGRHAILVSDLYGNLSVWGNLD